MLRPRGGVALLWNLWWNDGEDGTSDSLDPPLPAAARALFYDVYVRSGRAAQTKEFSASWLKVPLVKVPVFVRRFSERRNPVFTSRSSN